MKNFPMWRSSIVRTMLAGFLLMVFPVFSLCIISETRTVQEMQRETEATYSTRLNMTSEVFSENLLTLRSSVSTLLLDKEVIALSAQDRNHLDLYAFADFRDQLRLQFSSNFMDADVITVFPAQGMMVSSKTGVERISDPSFITELPSLFPASGCWSLKPSCYQNGSETFSMLLGYVRPSQSFPIVILEISLQELQRQIENLMLPNVQVQSAFLQDIQGRFFTAGGPEELISRELLEKVTGQKEESGELSPYYETSGVQRLKVFPVYLPDLNCVMGVAFDEQEILAPVLRNMRFIILVAVLGVLASGTYLFLIYKKVYSPMQQLTDSMQQVAQGNLTVQIQTTDRHEFGFLTEQFNSMTQRLQRLVKETYSLEIDLRKAQVRFLRTQINPHFLSNSLFCIYNMIKSQELDSAADMAIYLGKYYRLGVHLDELKLPLEQEMENIRLYLNIHRLRMRGMLTYTCEIRDGLEHFEVPSLSIQTIVENAMQHAFQKLGGPARVEVLAFRENGCAVISVEDNGSGIPEEKLRELTERFEETEQTNQLHGLQNVYSRMKLLFGEALTFNIERAEPHGTRIIIRIREQEETG